MDLEKHEVLKAAIKSLCQVFGSIDEESNLPAADLESRLFYIVIGATREDMFARWRTLSLASLLWVKGHYTTVEQGERENWIQSGVRALQDLRAQFDCDEEAFDMADQFLATLQNTQPDQMIGSVLSDMRVAFLVDGFGITFAAVHLATHSLISQCDPDAKRLALATGVNFGMSLYQD